MPNVEVNFEAEDACLHEVALSIPRLELGLGLGQTRGRWVARPRSDDGGL